MTRPDKSTIERLSFIKFLYGLGVEQSKTAEPMNAASLLMLHDSVELFLQVASEYLDVGKTQKNFLAYWDVFSGKLPDGGLTQKGSHATPKPRKSGSQTSWYETVPK